MKWEFHSSTAQQHSMPWNSHRRAACLRKGKCTLQVRERFFLLHPVCVFGCYLVLKMKHKSKINSDLSTRYTLPHDFPMQRTELSPILQGTKPEVYFVPWSIFLVPTRGDCTNSHLLYLLSPSSHHLSPLQGHHSFWLQRLSPHVCSESKIWMSRALPSRPPKAAHCSWNSIYTLAWPWGRADPASASPVFLPTLLASDPELCHLHCPQALGSTHSSRPCLFSLPPPPYTCRQVNEPPSPHSRWPCCATQCSSSALLQVWTISSWCDLRAYPQHGKDEHDNTWI